jgi:hypothetical protein
MFSRKMIFCQLDAVTQIILVVLGATGNQGGSVVKAIFGDPVTAEQFHVRASTRDPSKSTAAALVAEGVTVLKVCLINPQPSSETKLSRPIWMTKIRFVWP